MPISFEQPQPVAPNLSAAAGGAEQFTRSLPTLAGLYESAARLRFEAGQRQADRAQQSLAQQLAIQSQVAQGNADRLQQFSERGDALRLSSDDLALRQSPSARDAFEQNAAQQLQHDRFQQQYELQHAQFTQAEQMQLQQYNQAEAQVNRMVQDGQLSAAEGNDFLLQIRTGKSPLMQKQALSKAQADTEHLNAQSKMLTQHLTMMKSAEVENNEFERKLIEQGHGVLNWVDPDTGRRHPVIKNPNTGVWYNPLQAGKGDGGAGGPPLKPFDTTKAHKDAMAEAKLAFPDDVVTPEGKVQVSPEQLAKRNEYATRVFERDRTAWQQVHGVPGHGQIPPETANPGAALGGVAGASAPGRPAQPPYLGDGGKIEPKTAPQRAIQGAWDELKRNALKVVPEGEKAAYAANADKAMEYLARFGSVDAMPPDVRDHYERILKVLGQFNVPPPLPAPPQPPPPPRDQFLIGSGSF